MSEGTIFAPSWAVSRRNELVEAVYQDNKSAGLLHSDCVLLAFARYIAAHEEPPVDPLLIEARKIVKTTFKPGSHTACDCRAKIDAGEWDAGHKIQAALVGIRRGLELATERSKP